MNILVQSRKRTQCSKGATTGIHTILIQTFHLLQKVVPKPSQSTLQTGMKVHTLSQNTSKRAGITMPKQRSRSHRRQRNASCFSTIHVGTIGPRAYLGRDVCLVKLINYVRSGSSFGRNLKSFRQSAVEKAFMLNSTGMTSRFLRFMSSISAIALVMKK